MSTPHKQEKRTKKSQEAYKKTIERMQKRLPGSSRSFSRFIHQPYIESISELVGRTIARPSAILAGGFCSLIIVSMLYLYAKFIGFSLQGSETIIAFGIGWSIGILYDIVRVAFNKAKP